MHLKAVAPGISNGGLGAITFLFDSGWRFAGDSHDFPANKMIPLFIADHNEGGRVPADAPLHHLQHRSLAAVLIDQYEAEIFD